MLELTLCMGANTPLWPRLTQSSVSACHGTACLRWCRRAQLAHCRHDDELLLEFLSPALPDTLKKLRADPADGPKKEKKGKGKKK